MSKIQKIWIHSKHEKKKVKKEQWLPKYVKKRRRRAKVSFTVGKYRKVIESKKVLKNLKSSIVNTEEKEFVDNPLEGGDFHTNQQCEMYSRTEKNKLILKSSKSLLESVHSEIFQKHTEDLESSNQVRSNETLVKSTSSGNAFHEPLLSPEENPEDENKNILFDSSSNTIIYLKNPKKIEPHDSTIHVPEPDDDDYELDDEDEDKLPSRPNRRSSCKLPHTIVMSQYQNALHTPYEGGEYSESENEDVDAENKSIDSYETKQIYIQSGLRLLKPDESKLLLDLNMDEHSHMHHPHIINDGVQPLLKELSVTSLRNHHKSDEEDSASHTSSVVEEPEDDKEESKSGFSRTTVTSHPSGLIDTRPLLKFEEPEGVKDEPSDYSRTKITSQPSGLIVPRPLLEFDEAGDVKDEPGDYSKTKIIPLPSGPEPVKSKDGFMSRLRILKFRKKKDDICVHTEEVSDSKLQDFSSTTVDEVNVKEKNKRSIFKFFRKNDFCVHTAEPGQDTISIDSSGLSFFTAKENHSETKSVDYVGQKSKSVSEEHKVRYLAPIEESQVETTLAGVAHNSSSKSSSKSELESSLHVVSHGYSSKSSSRSSSRSNLSQSSRQHSILLPSNRERRLLQHQNSKQGSFSDSFNSLFRKSARHKSGDIFPEYEKDRES